MEDDQGNLFVVAGVSAGGVLVVIIIVVVVIVKRRKKGSSEVQYNQRRQSPGLNESKLNRIKNAECTPWESPTLDKPSGQGIIADQNSSISYPNKSQLDCSVDNSSHRLAFERQSSSVPTKEPIILSSQRLPEVPVDPFRLNPSNSSQKSLEESSQGKSNRSRAEKEIEFKDNQSYSSKVNSERASNYRAMENPKIPKHLEDSLYREYKRIKEMKEIKYQQRDDQTGTSNAKGNGIAHQFFKNYKFSQEMLESKLAVLNQKGDLETVHENIDWTGRLIRETENSEESFKEDAFIRQIKDYEMDVYIEEDLAEKQVEAPDGKHTDNWRTFISGFHNAKSALQQKNNNAHNDWDIPLNSEQDRKFNPHFLKNVTRAVKMTDYIVDPQTCEIESVADREGRRQINPIDEFNISEAERIVDRLGKFMAVKDDDDFLVAKRARDLERREFLAAVQREVVCDLGDRRSFTDLSESEREKGVEERIREGRRVDSAEDLTVPVFGAMREASHGGSDGNKRDTATFKSFRKLVEAKRNLLNKNN